MSILAHIADRVLNRPLLIAPEKAQIIMQVLAGRIGIDAPEANRFEGDDIIRDAAGRAIGAKVFRVADGVGIITITGSLVNRGAWIGANSGLTSYEGIQHQIKSAMTDPDARSVILDIHSPGGEAVGAFETAALVRQLSAEKPTIAVVNGMAASAAYAIASGAREIVTVETGVSGSIGVVLMHADFSRKLANEGVAPTLIFAGEHKVDGNPFEPLPQSVRADLQAEVNAFYDLFLKNVAEGRGDRLDVDAARATQARALIGKAAVDAGLADRIGTFESVLSELQGAVSGRRNNGNTRSFSMTAKNESAPAAEVAGISQADHDQAVAAARNEGMAEGRKVGLAEAHSRIQAVISAEGIAGSAPRMSAALKLALKSPDMSAEDVASFATENVPEASAPSLTERATMPDSLAQLGITEKPKAKTEAADWDVIVADLNRRHGHA